MTMLTKPDSKRARWMENRKNEWRDNFENGAIFMGLEMTQFCEKYTNATLSTVAANEYYFRMNAMDHFEKLDYGGWEK